MSKLSTLLRRAARSEPAPMGFTAMAGRSKNPEMLVSVSLGDLDVEAAVAAARGGADFLLLDDGDLDGDAGSIRAITDAVTVPCGLRLGKPSADASSAARALGLDYLRIEDHDTPAAVLLDEEMGFVLSVAGEAEDTDGTFLRILESMPFDALFAGELSSPFTLRRQLELRRVSGFAHKPLIVRARDAMTAQELECLRDSGVAAVLVEAKGGALEDLSALRQAIGAMQPRRRRRSERESMAVLPSVSHAGDDSDEDDDE